MTESLPDLIAVPDLLAPDEVRRGITRYVKALSERLHAEVEAARAERVERLGDTPLGRTDVAPLIRSLAGLADALDYGGNSLRGVAKEARALVGDEVRVTGESRVVTPDGNGMEVVAKVTAPRSRRVDVPGVLAALSAVRRTEQARSVDGQGPLAVEAVTAAYNAGYSMAQADVIAVGSISPSVTKIDALSRALQAAGQDDLAGLLDRCLTWESGDEKVTVTVEDPKRTRR